MPQGARHLLRRALAPRRGRVYAVRRARRRPGDRPGCQTRRSTMIAERVRQLLEQTGTPYETRLHQEAFTAQDVAAASRISGRHVAKVLIAKEHGGRFLMAVLPAPCRIDLAALRDAAGTRHLSLAGEAELSALFPDCDAGAMPLRRPVRSAGLRRRLLPAGRGVLLPGREPSRARSDPVRGLRAFGAPGPRGVLPPCTEQGGVSVLRRRRGVSDPASPDPYGRRRGRAPCAVRACRARRVPTPPGLGVDPGGEARAGRPRPGSGRISLW